MAKTSTPLTSTDGRPTFFRAKSCCYSGTHKKKKKRSRHDADSPLLFDFEPETNRCPQRKRLGTEVVKEYKYASARGRAQTQHHHRPNRGRLAVIRIHGRLRERERDEASVMAALRSALMGLARRSCGNSGSTAAAYMAGRGLGVLPSLRPAATRTPSLPSLRPAATRNLEGWRHFSTLGMEGAAQNKPLLMKQKAESILILWWQRSRDSMKNVTKDSTVVATAISFLTSFCILRSTVCSCPDIRTKNVHFHQPNAFASKVHPNAFASSTSTRPEPAYDRTNTILESPLPNCSMIPSFRGIYFSSLRPRRSQA